MLAADGEILMIDGCHFVEYMSKIWTELGR